MTFYSDFLLLYFLLGARIAVQYIPTVWGWINLSNLESVACEILISIMSKMSMFISDQSWDKPVLNSV